MKKYRKIVLVVLAILNSVVLLGQLWPEGEPPFAKTINILTLILNIVFIVNLFFRKTNEED
ncbi:hypothetical protein EG349_16785 [Chryseobacterium shandongense]|jgi:hypothetical protein|uniref:Uncharacterized protein n=1 Tax=Chryseobacterium shandongense TaxID=1493872 RepID=A0A3G6QVS7_9FLAO|nr:hypothetical protein [Chryseobacterium shandongense]AZA56466.1 hypothetical protein EG350_04425 [Chryseobacterium shandongense]AZA88309.1 hypothetical protein EG349_16785 [Chryseobacterium shandongense]AZA96870.1 hypothetical protein EG353_15575 [Chryseobacterium shandongense]